MSAVRHRPGPVTTVTTVVAVVLALLLMTAGAAPAGAATTLGRGATGTQVTDLQKRLTWLGVFTAAPAPVYGPKTQAAVSRFQEKFGLARTGVADPTTRARIAALTRRGPALDRRCTTGLVVCVDKTHKVVRLVRNGRVVQVMDARFGRKGLETREGRFSVTRKSRNHVSNTYGSPMPFALFFSGGQAVHYSPDFASRGYRGGSHGCVNVRDRRGAERLFDSVRVGNPVIVYRS